jgi:gamma-glutamyltranspeptidase / glutathione hydrolase
VPDVARLGTWELAEVLEFAIGYARNGIHVVPRISATIEAVRMLFETEWRSSGAVFLPGGKVPAPHSLFARPALAATYELIYRAAVGATREARIDAARAAWYRGFVAEAVDKFFRATDVLDVTGRRHRGLLAADDFARWSASVEDPVAYDYHGHTLLKCGPWSQGPVFLQQLALLRGFDIGAMDPFGAAFVHTVVECAKLAYADREAYTAIPILPPFRSALCCRTTTTPGGAGWSRAMPRWTCSRAPWSDTRPSWTATARFGKIC